jgi:pilus assembly protein CpaF
MSQEPNEALLRQSALAPIEHLLRDPDVTELMIDGCDRVYVEKHGVKQFIDIPTPFHSEQEVYELITAIVEPLGRRLDESNPIVNLRLADGSQVMVVIPPIALNGPSITIRRYSHKGMTLEMLLEFGSISKAEADFLQACVLARMNIVVAGGTSSGKTTFLNIISRFIPDDERIIICQSDPFYLTKKYVVNLEPRPANLEGRGEIPMREVVNTAGFMRPDRIIVTELHSEEIIRLLELMNNGHDGTMFSIHSSSARDAIARLEGMASLGNPPMPLPVIREQIAAALNVVLYLEMLPDGGRKVTRICEVTGVEEGVVSTRDLFEFRRVGMKDGVIQGYHTATGAIPMFLQQLHERGEYWQKNLPVSLFVPTGS